MVDEIKRPGWLLISDDKKISREHMKIRVDTVNSCVIIRDLGSSTGTWLLLMPNTREQLIPKIPYKSTSLDFFDFEIGAKADNLEEALSCIKGLEYLDNFLELGFATIDDVVGIEDADFELKLSQIEPDQKIIEKLIFLSKILKKNFPKNFFNSRLILKTTGISFYPTEIETGFATTYIGISSSGKEGSMLVNAALKTKRFKKFLFEIFYKEGLYFIKSTHEEKMFRALEANLDMTVYPGHEIELGSQLFELVQHINFFVGKSKNFILKGFTTISEISNISVFGVVEGIGGNKCAKFISENFVKKLEIVAKELRLDKASFFFKTLLNVIYKTFDVLDIEYMKKYPQFRARTGAKLSCILIIGQKIFSVNLGDIRCMALKKGDIMNLSNSHNLVKFSFYSLEGFARA